MCALRSTAERKRGDFHAASAAVAALGMVLAGLSGCGGGDASSGQSGSETQLLQQLDVAQHVNRGQATREPDGLHFTAVRGACQAYFPQFDPPEQYDLQVDVIREGKSGAVVIGLYAWGQQCRVVIDQPTKSGAASGLAPRDGKWPGDVGYPNPLSGGLLKAGQPATILCRVRRDRLVVQCNNVVIINLDRPTAKLGELPHFEIPHEEALSIGTWHGRATVKHMVVRSVPTS